MTSRRTPFDDVMQALLDRQLLMQQDQRLPSVVEIVTGESLRSSWWSHPKAQIVFDTLSRLSQHPDVLFTKLLADKVTLVHRALWPSLLAVVTAGASWQTAGLSSEARAVMRSLDAGSAVVSKTATKELERRLLAQASEAHTASGRHETRLEPWAVWAQRASCHATASEDDGKATLEAAARALGAELSALPWHRKRGKAAR